MPGPPVQQNPERVGGGRGSRHGPVTTDPTRKGGGNT